jgi:hypothetical protein
LCFSLPSVLHSDNYSFGCELELFHVVYFCNMKPRDSHVKVFSDFQLDLLSWGVKGLKK